MKRLTRHPAIFFAWPVAALAAAAALVAACTRAPSPNAPGASPIVPAQTSTQFQPYRDAQLIGHPVLTIDSVQSLIVATVRRAGPFARFGHDHAIASHRITGFVAPTLNRADFQFRLDEMTIDEPTLRAAAGLSERQPDADAIAGTRHNMLGPALEADRYPLVRVHVERIDDRHARATIALHGREQTMTVPVQVTGSSTLTAEGSLTMRQSSFGITPFTILGGALAVQDELQLRYRLVARPMN